MKKIINLLLSILIMFSLVACKKDDTSTSQIGLNEEYTAQEETATYTYKKSDLETDKVETVYVDTDQSGNVEKIEVETTLKSKEDGEIKDVANLENIINTSGDENYELKDGIIYFENHGEDITYKGNTNKELPVSIKLTYYLDGKEINPSDLAHKSGHVKIEFKYTNNTSSDYSNIKVPFICISLIMLDDEKFSNVTVENGKLLTMSDNKIVTLYGEPGLKDSLQLYKVDSFDDIKIIDTAYFEADVEDFTLDYTATLVSNGLFEDLEDNSINDLSDLNSKIDDIKDATSKLKDASNTLSDGVSKLYDGSSKLNDGIKQYNEGIKNIGILTQSMSDLADNLDNLASGEAASIEAIKTCVNTLSTYSSSLKACLESINTLKTYIDSIDTSLITYKEEGASTEEAINSLKNYDFSGVNECLTLLESLDTNLNTINDNLSKIDTSTLTTSSNTLKVAANTLNSNDSKNALIEGMSTITSGSSSLTDGIKTLNDNMPELTNATKEFSDKLNDAIDDSRDDLNKLSGTNMKNIINNLKNTKKVDSDYDSFVGKLDGMSSSVSFIFETSEIK